MWDMSVGKLQLLNTPAAEKMLNELSVMTVNSITALGPAMAAFKGITSPQLARAIQATENVWKRIEDEYGLLTSMEVAQLIGTGKSRRSLAADQRAAGKLMGVKRGNRILYPGFQFDRAAGKAHKAVPSLLTMAKDVAWDEEDLILWLLAPSGYFDGDRPVDHLADADLVAKGRQAATVEW
ncbi:MAG: hypothetical protein JWO93_755 [Micrococcaceae bacterium]|nr:hypothetical protein [Micrococcaceae bacterium]